MHIAELVRHALDVLQRHHARKTTTATATAAL
jgi:hypothetical protein